MTTPSNGDTVTIDYVLKRGDGEVVGNTEEAGPQQVQLGARHRAQVAAIRSQKSGPARTSFPRVR